MFTMQPNCGYSLVAEPMLYDPVSTSLSPLPVPLSLTWNNGVLTAGKCSTASFDSDIDCQSDPYEIIYDVVIVVSATNDVVTPNTDLDVRIEIGNTCLEDDISI